jgi:hypothetical protein
LRDAATVLRIRPCGLVIVVAALCTAFAAAPQAKAAPSAWWRLSQNTRPSALQDESRGILAVSVANLGDESANGESSPVSITDVLPPGLKPIPCPGGKQKPGCGVEGIAGENAGLAGNRGPVVCPTLSQTITCSFEGTLPPYDQIELRIAVEVQGSPEAGELENQLSVSGAGAPDASLKRALTVGGEEAFGVEGYELTPEEEGGALSTQAGSHPFQVTGSFTVKQSENGEPVALSKELNGRLPAGLIGNPTPLPQCTLGQFLTITGFFENQCPQQSVVGVAVVTIIENQTLGGLTTIPVPIFNVEPAVGEPARFGLYLPGAPVLLDPKVRTGSDYGITLGSSNITQTAALLAFKLVFWGVPGDQRHDNARGIGCIEAVRGEHNSEALPVCKAEENHAPVPFLSLPTSCTGPLQTSFEGASWVQPKELLDFPGAPMVAMDGCNRLSFSPSLRATPDGSEGATPTGLNVDVHVPQDSVLVAKGLAESNVKGITVTLPEGMAINPAGADGLQACPEALAGFTGFADLQGAPHTPSFTPALPEPLQQGANFCSDASKIGTATIHSPLLPRPLTGAVYLASQNENPFGSLIAMYLIAEDPVSGTVVKLPGEVSLSPSGQITTTFQNNPQLAFEDAEIHFFGGPRAPLSTPARCGTYTLNASFEPWSGGQDVSSQSSFQITTGPNGSPCPGASLPFSPTLTGGSSNIQAGAFTPFTTTISRPDGNQNLQSVTLRMPPGLSGILTGVPLCDEADANAGSCPEASRIGETIVSVGVGSDPFSVKGGKVYITGPYQGAPFGLSIVNPAKAGPFDLGLVIVRAKLEVDPHTAALTVTTDPSGPHAIPSILDGIPLQIQHVNVVITRPGFTFNPTNCASQSIGASIQSNEGASATQSVPFQVTNCATLKFAPKFSASTAAKTSKAKGASLKVKLLYPTAPFGSQANISQVKVELPKQLPSRLTTLQKACTAAQFEANPEGCPVGSRIGTARATTPLLPVPLAGTAYFVSHGNEAFPSLIIVLKGYGVTVDLVGTTLIRKGITSSTFKTVPDVPVGSFELTLPEGPFSALAANANLCSKTVTEHEKVKGKRKTTHHSVALALAMPTVFTAQNGATLTQSTKIAVSGCPKLKASKAKKTKKKRKGAKRK